MKVIDKSGSTGKDITISNSLQERVEFLETILNNLPHDLVVFDASHRYLFINNKAIKDAELRQWLIGRTDFDYCKYRNLDRTIAAERRMLFERALEQKQILTFEENRNGNVLSRNYLPIFDRETEKAKFMVGYAYDVTRIRNLESDLYRSNEELEKALNKLQFQHDTEIQRNKLRELIFQAKEIPTLCNDLAKELLKVFVAPYVMIQLFDEEMNCYARVLECAQEDEDDMLWKSNQLNMLLDNLKKEHNPDDENHCYFEGSAGLYGLAAALDSGNGFFEGCIVIGNLKGLAKDSWELTLIKELSVLLALKVLEVRTTAKITHTNEWLMKVVDERTQSLQELNASLKMFASAASHDLNTPLRHISAFTNILRSEIGNAVTPKMNEYLDFISGSTKKMSSLIASLLNFSKVDIQEISTEPIAPEPLIKMVLDNQKMLYPEKQFEINVDASCLIHVDPILIVQVFDNLISNAFKYSSKKDVIKLQVKQVVAADQVIFYFKDNGTGFDNNYAERLFLPFHRLHHQKDFEGSGIGLATVKKIVDKHRGSITAISKQDGAEFVLRLPNLKPDA